MLKESQNSFYYKIIYFFVANQVVFKRMFVVFLILFNIIVWWVGGVKIVNYLAYTNRYEKILMDLSTNRINLQDYRSKHKEQELVVKSVNRIKVANKKYDLVAKIYNPNSDWAARKIKYAFVVDGFLTDWQDEFISSKQTKFLFNFSRKFSTAPKTVELKIGNVDWQRVKNKDLNFILNEILIDNKTFSVINDSTNKTQNLSELKFKAINQSNFSLWQIGFQIVLYKNSLPIAANYATLENFLNNQERKVSVIWPNSIQHPDRIEIVPDLNFFDASNFISNSRKKPAVNLIKGASVSR